MGFFFILLVFFLFVFVAIVGVVSKIVGGVFSLFSPKWLKNLFFNKDGENGDNYSKSDNFAGENKTYETNVLVRTEAGMRRMSVIKEMAEDVDYEEVRE